MEFCSYLVLFPPATKNLLQHASFFCFCTLEHESSADGHQSWLLVLNCITKDKAALHVDGWDCKKIDSAQKLYEEKRTTILSYMQAMHEINQALMFYCIKQFPGRIVDAK